jgi:hypothetical protein
MTKKASPKHVNPRISVVVDPEDLEVFKRIAEIQGLTLSSFMRMWMKQSVPQIKNIIAMVDEAYAGNPAQALLGFAAQAGTAFNQQQAELHELLAHVNDAQNNPPSPLIMGEDAKPKDKNRPRKA